MEKLQPDNDNGPKSAYERVNDVALGKRAAYIEALKSSHTFEGLSLALETYAVSDEDEISPKSVVISFAEPDESGFSELIGAEELETIVAGMVRIATENLKGMNEIRALVFDADLADRIYEIQNQRQDIETESQSE